MSVSRRVKPHIAGLEPYQPGKPIEELERELGIEGAVKLASNESPVGPSPKAVAAMAQILPEVHRYPDGGCFALRAKLSRRLDVSGEQLIFGSGSDEILELLAKAFLGEGDEAVFAWPSFAMYPIVVQGAGARAVSVPLDANRAHDLVAMAKSVTPQTKLVFVCNPNNPTGTSVGAEAFDGFVEALPADVILVVDEAYFEFVRRDDFPDALGWAQRRPGTLVLRTFSKIYGLAGLRVGYGVGDPELIGYLERARHPFNVSLVAQVAAAAALDDDAHVARSREVNAHGLAYLERELGQLGIETCPSDANFILAQTGPGCADALLQAGVIVRPMGGFGLPDFVRISVGLPEENERLIKVLRRLREGGGS